MRTCRAAERSSTAGSAVGVTPLTTCLLRLLPVFGPWSLVVVGRRVCLVAQRVPPAVRLVRAVQEQRARRAA